MGRWLSKEQQAHIESLVLKDISEGLTNEQIVWRENITHDRLDNIRAKHKLASNKEYSTRQADKNINKFLHKLEDEVAYVRKFP